MMAVEITELLEGRTVNTVSSTAQRIFRVTDPEFGVTENAARAAAVTFGLVNGAAFPDPTVSLLLKGIQTRPEGCTVVITAEYVLPELSFPQRPIDPTSPNFQSMNGTYRRESVELPSFEQFDTAVENGDMYTLWRREAASRRFTKREHVYRYRLTGTFVESLTVSQWLQQLIVIDNQADRLHKFNGIYYRFEPSHIGQETLANGVDPAQFRIEYNWVFDPGIRVRDANLLSIGAEGPGGSGGNTNLRHFYSQTPIGRGSYFPVEDPANRYILRPFRSVQTSPHPNGPEFPPLTVFSDEYEKDDTGWLSLPGIA
jgi:hypothetical protein